MKGALKRGGQRLGGGRSHFISGYESRANSSGKMSSVKKKTNQKNSTKPTLVKAVFQGAKREVLLPLSGTASRLVGCQ